MRIIVTGGLGFIGGNFINYISKYSGQIDSILNVDYCSYAANKELLVKHRELWGAKYSHSPIDISWESNLEEIDWREYTHLIHFAAESHVDNSISNPSVFIKSNIVGTFNLLNSINRFNKNIRMLHVSTDEVFGFLFEGEEPFNESNRYRPSSPYSASKASSDLLVEAWGHTFKLNTVVTNCSNNYGPYQNKEKLIPKAINNLLEDKKVPVYASGKNIRDWVFVEDHCEALWQVLNSQYTGESFCIGGENEKTNIEVVSEICKLLNKNPNDCIEYVKDRPGHDFRYALSNRKITSSLGWKPQKNFIEGLKETIEYYRDLQTKNR